MCNLCINSDFTDYYDYLSDNNSSVVYNRFLKESMQRGTALKYLRNFGIHTLIPQQVNSVYRDANDLLVVYTDPKLHGGQGKKIMTASEASNSYGNYLCTPYYVNKDKLSVKYVQIGDRRISLQFHKDNEVSLDLGTLVDINETVREFNPLFSLPIFSIDYINVDGVMIATDFNEVQNLQSIGMDKYINAQEAITLIADALIKYNKI